MKTILFALAIAGASLALAPQAASAGPLGTSPMIDAAVGSEFQAVRYWPRRYHHRRYYRGYARYSPSTPRHFRPGGY